MIVSGPVQKAALVPTPCILIEYDVQLVAVISYDNNTETITVEVTPASQDVENAIAADQKYTVVG